MHVVIVLGLALAALPAAAGISGLSPSECARMWTHALDPNNRPQPNSLLGQMKQLRENAPPWIRQQGKVDLIAGTRGLDPAVARLTIEDEIGTSLDESKPELDPAFRDKSDADARGASSSANSPKIVCRNRYRTGNNINGVGEVYYGCEPRP